MKVSVNEMLELVHISETFRKELEIVRFHNLRLKKMLTRDQLIAYEEENIRINQLAGIDE